MCEPPSTLSGSPEASGCVESQALVDEIVAGSSRRSARGPQSVVGRTASPQWTQFVDPVPKRSHPLREFRAQLQLVTTSGEQSASLSRMARPIDDCLKGSVQRPLGHPDVTSTGSCSTTASSKALPPSIRSRSSSTRTGSSAHAAPDVGSGQVVTVRAEAGSIHRMKVGRDGKPPARPDQQAKVRQISRRLRSSSRSSSRRRPRPGSTWRWT